MQLQYYLQLASQSQSSVGGGGIARPFSTQFISVTEILSKSLLGFKKVTVEASEITVGYMTI